MMALLALQDQPRVSAAGVAALAFGPALTCFWLTRVAPTSAARAVAGTAGLECGGRAMRFTAVGGHIFTIISMQFA